MYQEKLSNSAQNQLIKDMFSFFSQKYEDDFFLKMLTVVKSKIVFFNLILILPVLTVAITMRLDLVNAAIIIFVFYCLNKQYNLKKLLEGICWQRSVSKKEIFLCNVKQIVGDESYYETFQAFKKAKVSNELKALLDVNDDFNNYDELFKNKLKFKEETMISFTKENR